MAYSIGSDGTALIGGTGAGERLHRWPGTTRRGVQVVLGVLWLLDGALQLQPFMFTTDFAQRVLAPSGQHQPAWVAAPTDFSATDPNTGPLIVLMALALVGLPRRGESSSRTHLLVGRVRHDVA
jgi:hypothetical protein